MRHGMRDEGMGMRSARLRRAPPCPEVDVLLTHSTFPIPHYGSRRLR
jgi:hypothetical protein